MSRIKALCGAFILALLAACAGPATGVPGAASDSPISAVSMAGGVPLSAAGVRVSQIAARNGDRDYIMLDKAHGRIIAFQGGRPTFSGAALTGENPVDYLQPDATSKSFHETGTFKYKITPAGRYTVGVGFDPAYGETLDVNEVQGKDWDIAIHKVWLGAPAEHRDARLRSPAFNDKHITYGCIDVDGPTMQGLLARIPDEEHTPLYILPQDESLIIKFFPAHDEARKLSTPAG
jgi:hypothetical protein